MDSLFKDFAKAYTKNDGYLLSSTISPNLSNDQLRAIWKSCNAHDVKNVVKRRIQNYVNDLGFDALSSKEIQGWVDVYAAYWKAIGELLATQDSSSSNYNKVSTPCPTSNHPSRSSLNEQTTLTPRLDRGSLHGQRYTMPGRKCSLL